MSEYIAEAADFFAKHFPVTAPRLSVEAARGGALLVWADVRGLGHGPVRGEKDLLAKLTPGADGKWTVKMTKTKYERIDGVAWALNTNKPESGFFTVADRIEMPLKWGPAPCSSSRTCATSPVSASWRSSTSWMIFVSGWRSASVASAGC